MMFVSLRDILLVSCTASAAALTQPLQPRQTSASSTTTSSTSFTSSRVYPDPKCLAAYYSSMADSIGTFPAPGPAPTGYYDWYWAELDKLDKSSSTLDACIITDSYPPSMSSAFASYDSAYVAASKTGLSCWEAAKASCAEVVREVYSDMLTNPFVCSTTRSVWATEFQDLATATATSEAALPVVAEGGPEL